MVSYFNPTLAKLQNRPEEPEEPAEDQRHGNELYTGGERSGLAVQNPDQGRGRGGRGLVNDILQQARR